MICIQVPLIAFLLLGVAGLEKQKKKPKPEVNATVSDLEGAYSDNPIAADKKYKGKVIQLTGKIDEIGRVKMSSSSYISFTIEGKVPIQAHFMKEQEDLLLKIKRAMKLQLLDTLRG